MDRVREPGDASVPFRFDTHALCRRVATAAPTPTGPSATAAHPDADARAASAEPRPDVR